MAVLETEEDFGDSRGKKSSVALAAGLTKNQGRAGSREYMGGNHTIGVGFGGMGRIQGKGGWVAKEEENLCLIRLPKNLDGKKGSVFDQPGGRIVHYRGD